jgi:AcrR family transcriptional regulator
MNTQPINRHERRRLQTRAKLITTHIELILEKGYDAITVQDITDRADLGRGTFYIHFKDKEDITWTVIKEGLDSADREAHERMRINPPEQLDYFGYCNIFRHAQQNRDLYRIMFGSMGSAMLTDRVYAYLAEDLEREALTILRGDPTPPRIPITIWAQIITGAVMRSVIWWLETENDYTPEQMAGLLYWTLHHREPPG